MSERQPRTLRINKPTGRAGWAVELDGHDISRALVGLSLKLDSSPLAEARLDVIAEELPIEAQVHVVLPDATKELLVRLGWTPPAEEAQP
ncbi:hypothetical protein [Streptomyces rubradiris]|uniref:STAS domain-containing protein n=1 Tax=Streptomyces rubradiris TaxID=285531 RepID=A0ABQ3R3I7_STRRR|nr:hypothetical protein [Streptomyces rubradiris]GHH30229.1 hypothetical protein GCM10018792_76450 [Streptomyces rubradiris]GHI50426.1 hypothetical protein Srubr_02720 [Streptomyces rubradiris]